MIINFSHPHSGENLTAFVVQSLSEIRPEQKTPNAIFYQLSDGGFYQWSEINDGTMRGIAGFFGKIAGIAAPFANFIPGVGQFVSAGLGVASALVQGKPGQARGLSQINQFGQQILNGLDSLQGQMTPANAFLVTGEADKLVALLSDSNAVYQAKKGKDAEALENFKQQAQMKANAIKAAATELAARPQNPQAAPSANSNGNLTNPANVALYAVGGIAAFLILRKLL